VGQDAAVLTDPLLSHLSHLRLRNLSVETIKQRRCSLTRLARQVGCDTSDLLALLPEDLEDWQDTIGHYSARYRASWTGHIRAFYRWAGDRELIRNDPSQVLVSVQLPRLLPKPISEIDLDTAIRCAPDRIRPWLVLAGYAGLRAAEIASLNREQIRERSDPPVIVVFGKGSKERIVPLSDIVLDELAAHGLPSRGPVFLRRDGKFGANTAWNVSHLANDYLHDLGITDTLHSCRHRFGTELYRLSRDLRLVQEVLGHSSPMTTAGYAAYSRRDAADVVQMLGRTIVTEVAA
jgi:integrase/recombinase XerC